MTLTDTDRRNLAKARELAAIDKLGVLRVRYGTSDVEDTLTDLWGESAHLLHELAAIIDRLEGQPLIDRSTPS